MDESIFHWLLCSLAYSYGLHHGPGEMEFRSNVYKLYSGVAINPERTQRKPTKTYEEHVTPYTHSNLSSPCSPAPCSCETARNMQFWNFFLIVMLSMSKVKSTYPNRKRKAVVVIIGRNTLICLSSLNLQDIEYIYIYFFDRRFFPNELPICWSES